MSQFERMLNQLCPKGVKYKKLGEVGTFIRGNGLQKKDFTESGVGCIHYGQVYTHYGLYTYETKSFVSVDFAKKLRKAKTGNLVIAATSENDEDVCKAVAWLGKDEIAVSGDAFIYEHTLDPKYMAYFFQSKHFQLQKMPFITGAKVRRVNGDAMEKILIPVPPIKVQEEVSRILDTLSKLKGELEAELEAELDARKKQYQHYLNSLLNFEDRTINASQPASHRVRWMTLAEMGTIVRGNGLQKKDFTESGVGCIHYGQIYTFYGTYTDTVKSYVSPALAKTLKQVEKGDLVIAVTSENMEDVCKCVAYLGDETIVTGGHAMILKHKENPKYLAYYFQTRNFYDQKTRYARGAKVIDISKADMEKIRVAIPELKEQDRIVSILEKFEALVCSVSERLPAEIKARCQQYEFYRDQLLSFQEIQ